MMMLGPAVANSVKYSQQRSYTRTSLNHIIHWWCYPWDKIRLRCFVALACVDCSLSSEYWRLSELAPACKNVWVSGLLCLLRVSVSSMLLYKSSRIIMYLARFTLCSIYCSPPLDLMMILCITFALAQDWHIDVFSKIRSNAFFCLWVISARFCIMTTSQLRLRTQAFTHRKLSHRECTQALSHIAAFTDRCSLLHKKHFPLESFTRKCFCTQEV